MWVRIIFLFVVVALMFWPLWITYIPVIKKKETKKRKKKCSPAHIALMNTWLNDYGFLGIIRQDSINLLKRIVREKEYTEFEQILLNNLKQEWIVYKKLTK